MPPSLQRSTCGPARRALRQAVADAHLGMEAAMAASLQLSDRATYRALLWRYLRAYAPLEAALQNFAAPLQALHIDLGQRRKLPLLQRDLDSLGQDAAIEPPARVPPAPVTLVPPGLASAQPLPALHTLPQALGCLYVMEGATLGGQQISRQLQTRLQLQRPEGLAFFRSYGAQVGPRWRQFCGALEAGLAQPQQLAAAILSAQQTFRYFRLTLSLAQPE